MTSLVVSLKQYNTQSRISPEIIGAVFIKLGTRNVHRKRNRMTPTILFPWQHSWLQSLSVKNNHPHLQSFKWGQRV